MGACGRCREWEVLVEDAVLLEHNCTLMQKMYCHEENRMHAVRTSMLIEARSVARADWAADNRAVDPEAGNTVRTGKMLPKMRVTLGRAPSGRDTRSHRQSPDDQRAREDVPAHHDEDVRMWSEEEEEPWEDEGIRLKEGACDSLVHLFHAVAADAPSHHTSAVRTRASAS